MLTYDYCYLFQLSYKLTIIYQISTTFCGHDIPPLITSMDGKCVIYFHSDHEINGAGFNLTFRQIKKGLYHSHDIGVIDFVLSFFFYRHILS